MAHTRVKWRGRTVCSCVKISVEQVIEPRLRAECGWAANRKLRIFQGCYSNAVSKSGGTHGEGGALDTEKLNDAETRVARECGTTSWQRGTPQDTYFDDHNHWIFIGCPDLSPEASSQVTAYRRGKNGLANGGPDKSPRVAYITWQDALKKYKPKPPPQKEGLLGMSTLNKFGNGKVQSWTGDGGWKTVKIDDKGGMVYLDKKTGLYIVVAGYDLVGLPVGAVCQFRFITVKDYDDPKKPSEDGSHYPIHEAIGTEGHTFGHLMWMNDLAAGGPGYKWQVRLNINPPKGVKVDLIRVDSRIAY